MNDKMAQPVSRRKFLAGTAATAGAFIVPQSHRFMNRGPLVREDNLAGKLSRSSAELTFMFWGTTNEKNADAASAAKFTGAKVNIEYTPGNYDAKLASLIAANRPPDVAYLGIGTALSLGSRGQLVNLVKYFNKYPQLAAHMPQSYYFWAPGQATSTFSMTTTQIWYNKAAFTKAGVGLPPIDASKAWSWDRFIEVAQALTLDHNGKRPTDSGFDATSIRQYGAWLPSNWQQVWEAMLYSNGGSIVNATGTKYELNSPESIKVFQAMQDLIYKYHVSPGPGENQNQNLQDEADLQSGLAAMVLDGEWVLADLAQSGLDYGVGVLPKFQEPRTTTQAAGGGIFSTSKHVEQALEFYLSVSDPATSPQYSTDGLWMPLQKKYYTQDKYIKSWTGSKIYPPGYRQAAVDYILHYGVPQQSHLIKNQFAIQNALTAGLAPIFAGTSPAKEVLNGLKATIEPMLAGMYPDPRKQSL